MHKLKEILVLELIHNVIIIIIIIIIITKKKKLSNTTYGVHIYMYITYIYGAAVSQWLRCCATNRKVAGSIPDGVIGIFH